MGVIRSTIVFFSIKVVEIGQYLIRREACIVDMIGIYFAQASSEQLAVVKFTRRSEANLALVIASI